MYTDPPVWDRINSFALIAYVPEPLAGFLDRLRQELVPNCFVRAHVTLLPPRSLSSSPEEAWEAIRAQAAQCAPFEIELAAIDVFPVSDVIYIQVTAGCEKLNQLHEAMNVNGLTSQEEFRYQPHVTLAQDLKPDQVDELVRVARSRWAECPYPRSFRMEKVFFVQNTRGNEWVDLGECELGRDASKLATELTDSLVG